MSTGHGFNVDGVTLVDRANRIVGPMPTGAALIWRGVSGVSAMRSIVAIGVTSRRKEPLMSRRYWGLMVPLLFACAAQGQDKPDLPKAGVAGPGAPKRTALDDYIAKPDPTYSWKLV